jgi:hypothetical protein
MNWLSPEIEITIGDVTRVANVSSMIVDAGYKKAIATACVELSNVHSEWAEVASGDGVTIQWGFKGETLHPLFEGTVEIAHNEEILKIIATCRCQQLVNTRVTRTYVNEQASAVVANLISQLDFEGTDIEACATEIDKLPLEDDTILSALKWLDRRLVLNRSTWCDQTGKFHWRSPAEDQDAVASFIHGEDVLSWETLATGRKKMVTLRSDLWHSDVIDVSRVDDTVATRYFVERVRHLSGGKVGMRSEAWLREIAA